MNQSSSTIFSKNNPMPHFPDGIVGSTRKKMRSYALLFLFSLRFSQVSSKKDESYFSRDIILIPDHDAEGFKNKRGLMYTPNISEEKTNEYHKYMNGIHQNNIQHNNRLLSDSVLSQNELNDALKLGSSNIEIASDIILTVGMNITSDVSINGNNNSIFGPQNGLKVACFSINSYMNIEIKNLTVSNCGTINKFTVYGGAFYVAPAATLILFFCNMFNNVAYVGGAIYVDAYATLYTIDTLVSDNTALLNLGGIVSGYAANHYGTRLIFRNNYAYGYGGALGLYYASGIFEDLVIDNNEAVYEAGGMVMVQSNCQISNSIISNNKASLSGGLGIYSSSVFEGNSLQIKHNVGEVVAGGIGSSNGAQLTLTSSNISFNTAAAGGAVAADSASVIYRNCTIIKNTAISSLTFSLISGNCSASFGCFYSPKYPDSYGDNGECVIQPNANGILDVEFFFTEGDEDFLTVNDIQYSGYEGPSCVNVSKGDNITWLSNNLYDFPGFEICLKELVSGGGGLLITGGSTYIYDSKFIDNFATRVGGTLRINGGDVILYDTSITAADHELLAPIHANSGYLTATGLTLTGNIEGTSAVISNCNSACGSGKIGNCSTAGEYAPSCYVNCACDDCPAGTYSTASGGSTDKCYNCPTAYSSEAGSSRCVLADVGYYIDTNGTSQECPDHAQCDGGLELPRPEDRFWVDRSNVKKSVNIHKCYRETCKGSTTSDSSCWLSECYGDEGCSGCDSDELQCLEGSEGPLCGSCSSGYSYSSSSLKCLACDVTSVKMDESIAVIGMIVLFGGLLGGLYFGYDHLPVKMREHSLFTFLKQFLDAVIRHSDSGALRVLWVNYQILDSISWTLEITFPTPLSEYLNVLHLVSFDLFIMDCIPGGYLTSVYIWSLIPIGCSLINYIISELRVSYLKLKSYNLTDDESKIKEIQDTHFYIFLIIIFSLLPPVVRRQFVALNCFELNNDRYLKIDTNVDCNSSSYELFVLFDILMILIYMTIPLYWALLLYRQRAILNPPITDEQLVYYLRDNDEELQPIRFLFVPYRPRSLYFESFEMYRRIVFIGILPLLSSHSDRRAAIGVMLSLCSLELFRNLEPFRLPSTNLLAYVAQYAVLLTFAAALVLNAGIADGLSNWVTGVMLLSLNVSVFAVAVASSTLRFLDEKERKKIEKENSTKKVEWACEFTPEKFKTTFDAITEHSVPPASVLCFWYTDMISAKQALRSGIPATKLEGNLKSINSLLGQRMGGIASKLQQNDLGGVLVTLHSPSELDEDDFKHFPEREVVLACSVPRKFLTSLHSSLKNVGCGIRVVSAYSLQALRGNYFGLIDDPRPWYNGGIFLHPKSIRRAYQLIEMTDIGRQSSMAVTMKDLPHQDSLQEGREERSFTLSQSISRITTSSRSTSRLLSRNPLKVFSPSSCMNFTESMTRIRGICTVNGWAPVYHFTQPIFGHMIAKTGFRMSTQGQGDGGVYFSTKGPCSYGLGTSDYEKNIIIDCFGENRLHEYQGKHLLDLLIVYGALPQVLSLAPGGRDNAVMVRKSDFEALSNPHADGNYFLRPDRILGIFHLSTYGNLKDRGQARYKLALEVKRDLETKKWISLVQGKMMQHELENSESFRNDSYDEMDHSLGRLSDERQSSSPSKPSSFMANSPIISLPQLAYNGLNIISRVRSTSDSSSEKPYIELSDLKSTHDGMGGGGGSVDEELKSEVSDHSNDIEIDSQYSIQISQEEEEEEAIGSSTPDNELEVGTNGRGGWMGDASEEDIEKDIEKDQIKNLIRPDSAPSITIEDGLAGQCDVREERSRTESLVMQHNPLKHVDRLLL